METEAVSILRHSSGVDTDGDTQPLVSAVEIQVRANDTLASGSHLGSQNVHVDMPLIITSALQPLQKSSSAAAVDSRRQSSLQNTVVESNLTSPVGGLVDLTSPVGGLVAAVGSAFTGLPLVIVSAGAFIQLSSSALPVVNSVPQTGNVKPLPVISNIPQTGSMKPLCDVVTGLSHKDCCTLLSGDTSAALMHSVSS